MVYNNLSGYFREKYNGRIKKICIDGGFTCPNRDGSCGVGGCIFCGERGAGEHISSNGLSIANQVNDFFSHMPKADGFIAYFQNFTNTYAPINILKERYDAALIDDRIVALAVGTRPDCITDEIAELLSSYRSICDVWVELGLQTSNDNTAKAINRGYFSDAFSNAITILKKWDLPVVVHIIIGLPGETKGDVMNTINFINMFNLWGIKIHSIYVMKGTALENLYNLGLYTPPTLEEYVEIACSVLAHIRPNMIVHRLTGDCPKDMLVAPAWNEEKNRVLSEINHTMMDNGWTQGCLFEDKGDGIGDY